MKNLLCSIAVLSACSAQAASAPQATAGTTIVGEHEAAVGLYLMPWKNEDRPAAERVPALFTVLPEPANAAQDQAQVLLQDTIASTRRSRMQFGH